MLKYFYSNVINFVKGNKILSRIALFLIPDWYFVLSTPFIGKFRIRLRRNRSFWLRDPLSLEKYPLSVLKIIVKPGDVVWDVGANIGLYSRWFITKLGAIKVFAFEPMSENLPDLYYNLKIGNILDKVTVCPFAISENDGQVEFQVDNIQSASGAIDSVYNGKASRARSAIGLEPVTEIVNTRCIDSIVQEKAVLKPDVIKVDIEGAELMLLLGGKKYFSENSPKLLIETHGLEVSKKCIEFLFDLGYFVAASVPSTVNPTGHQQIFPDYLLRMTDQYDAHFLVACKNLEDLPIHVNVNDYL